MPSILDWSTTPISNSNSDSAINWAELQNPDTVNDSARQMMGRIAEWRDDLTAAGRSATGSAGAYVVTSASTPDTLLDGFVIWFLPNHDNPGASTLKVNSQPVKPLRGKANTALAGGEILTSVPTGAMYSEANDEFLLINSAYPVISTGQAIAGSYNSGLRIGDVVLSIDTAPKSGRIRLGEAVQVFDPVAYPELSEWLTAQGSPWGAYTLPSAAGYFLRFGSTTATIDPDGPRAAGVTQSDAIKSHLHAKGTLGGSSTPNNSTQTLPNGGGTTGIDAGLGAQQLASTDNFTVNFPNHTLSISGSTATQAGGATETRGINVTMHADIIASTSEANVDVYAVNGQAYQFDDGITDTDPGSGRLALNSATLASVTEMYISQTGKFGEDLSAWLLTWDDSTSTVRGQVSFYKVGAPANFAIYQITGSATDNSSYDTFTLTYINSGGSFSDDDNIGVQFSRTGQKGDTGSSGGGISFAWDTSTTDSDPGTGNLRANNATLASVTEFYCSTTDSNSSDNTTYLDSLDDSTSTVKGYIQFRETANPGNFALYQLTSVTTATGYRKFGVTFQSGNGSFDASDSISMTFNRTGDVGSTGSTGAAGADGADPGLLYTFSTTTTDADPGAGYVRANNASLASATALYVDDVDRDANNQEAELLTWDDSTNATTRGKLLIKTPSDGAVAVFDITGASTDAAGYVKLAVTYVSGATSFANDASISLQFAPAGNDGAGAVDSVNGDTGAVTVKKLVDTNGVDAVLVGTAASAVNEVTVTNAATTAHPSVTATGDDVNINLDLAGKGSGVVRAGGVEVVTLTGTQTLTNKTLTSPVLNTGVSGTAVLDEDNMASDSATKLATQQSIKAYVDNRIAATDTTQQIFTASGTYTPPSGLVRAQFIVVGGGGGGGAAVSATSGGSAGGGGGAGGVAIKMVEAADISGTNTVTINSGGGGGTTGAGTAGGSSSIVVSGVLTLSATGGAGGDYFTGAATVAGQTAGAAAGVGSNGDINFGGAPGGSGWRATTDAVGGNGGSGPYGGGGAGPRVFNTKSVGVAASGYGAGGSGAAAEDATAGASAGGAGTTGIVIVTEFY